MSGPEFADQQRRLTPMYDANRTLGQLLSSPATGEQLWLRELARQLQLPDEVEGT